VLISSEAEWQEFEVERWRCAIRERGLRLGNLDPDQLPAFLDMQELPDGSPVRRRTAGKRFAGRLVGIVLLIALGYFVHDFQIGSTLAPLLSTASSSYSPP
jgi:hypothetical protein